MGARRKLLVVRGDLRSHYGYSKALRAHLRLLRAHFDEVVGVDIHYHPARSLEKFPGEVLSDEQADQRIAAAGGSAVLLNYTTPENFRRHPRAVNIGLFYWETDRYNVDLNWKGSIALMDAMWIPVEFMRDAIARTGFQGPISLIPWPQREPVAAEAAPEEPVRLERMLPESRARRIGLMGALRDLTLIVDRPKAHRFRQRLGGAFERAARGRHVPLAEVRSQHRFVYLSVLQDVPRKGLYVLLSEWLSRVRANPKPESCLVLKLSSLDVGATSAELYVSAYNRVRQLARSAGVEDCRIYLCFDRLSEEQMHALYRAADAVLSTSLGEGFGGPIVEAALRRVPVFSPRHTSFTSILPESYAFNLKHAWRSVSLKNQLAYYPLSSMWGLIGTGELERAIARFESMPEGERRAAADGLRRHVLDYCGESRVAGLIAEELSKEYLR